MNKRLRKKKRKGEFAEFGFPIAWRWARKPSNDDLDVFWDNIIAFAESRGLGIGGGSNMNRETSSAFVTKLGRGSATEADRTEFIGWMTDDPIVGKFIVGEMVDAWYGPFDYNFADRLAEDA